MSGKQNIPHVDGEIGTDPEQPEREVRGPETGQEQPEVPTDEAIGEKIDGEEIDDTGARIESLSQEIENQKQLAGEYLDRALRAQAEMDNLRKRTTRDIENAHKYALEKFVSELLPVLDSMDLGISASQDTENVQDLREGMDLTRKMLFSCMEKFGVKVIDPQGEKFNPEQHEAISMLDVEGADTGMVTTVVQKGYELNGRLVRPAMVVVAK